MVYGIYEGNMEKLEKKLKTIGNKCAKFGCEFSFEKVGEEIRAIKFEDGHVENLKFILVDVSGKAVLNDWVFVGSVDWTENGNVIRSVNGEDVPARYFDTDPICEHCGVKRFRKYTFIVRNEKTGEYKQVGKSCLKDFTGGLSAEDVARYLSYFDVCADGGEVFESGGRWKNYYETGLYAKYVAEAIRCWGFRKNDGYDYSTKEMAWDCMAVNGDCHSYLSSKEREAIRERMDDAGFDVDREENEVAVKEAFDWIANKDDGGSTYLHDLKVICGLEYVDAKHMGLLASVFQAKKRDDDAEAEKIARDEKHEAEKVSEWQGVVGKRVEVEIAECDVVTSWETMYGTTYIWKIVDKKGNVFTWKTGNGIDESTAKIVGIVKEHKEYRGVRQTELTRCRQIAGKREEKHEEGTFDLSVIDVLYDIA